MLPGSTLRKLEAITGGNVSKIEVREKMFLYVLYFSFVTDPAISYLGNNDRMASEQLRSQNWKRVCNNVATAQEWRCADCGQCKPLQGHHKIYRSRWRRADGPLDAESNVKMICALCHEREHRG